MSDQRTPRRARKSTSTLRHLEAARRRRAEQIEAARERERRVDAALGPFAEASAAIDAARTRCAERIAAIDARLSDLLETIERRREARLEDAALARDEVEARTDAEIAILREQQAGAVREIRAAEMSVSQTAELLGLSIRTVSQLARTPERDIVGIEDASAGAPGPVTVAPDEAEDADTSPATGGTDAPGGWGPHPPGEQ